MAVGNTLLKLIFGPCLDNSAAVEPRYANPQTQQRHHRQPRRQYQSQQQYKPKLQLLRTDRERKPTRSIHFSSNLKRFNFSQKSKRLAEQPPQNTKHLLDPPIENDQCPDNANGSDRRKSRQNSDMRSSKIGNGKYQPTSPSRHNGRNSDHIASVNNSRRRYRRDDALNMSASLIETYRGYSFDEQTDYLDEQSAIRRSCKESSIHQNKQFQTTEKLGRSLPPQYAVDRKNERHRQDPPKASHTAEKSEFESGIEKMEKLQSAYDHDNEDNVTTISKASINPYHVLGISKKISSRELHTTYEMKLMEAEKFGASDKAFRDVGNAYRRIQAEIKRQEAREERRKVEQRKEKKQQRIRRRRLYSDEESGAKTRRECIDARLKDHRELVQGLFANDNNGQKEKNSVTTLQNSIQSQEHALADMNLVPVEAGALNINEQNVTIQNSCFYLSLAASYLSGVGAFVEDPTRTVTSENRIAILENEQKQHTMKLALQLKRAIEAAVLLVHPDWAKSGLVGEEVQAFSDFLVYALDSDSILSHWTIAVFDDESGFVDIFRGRHYGKIYPPTKRTMARQRVIRDDGRIQNTSSFKWRYKDCDRYTKRTNTLTLRYTTGHYQPLLPELTKVQKWREREGNGSSTGLTDRPALEDILATLEKWEVLHVVTDGRADFNPPTMEKLDG